MRGSAPDLHECTRFQPLPQYAKSFRHNMIDGHMLATLDAKDLMDLGVDNRFHRRRLALKIGLLTGGGDRDGGS